MEKETARIEVREIGGQDKIKVIKISGTLDKITCPQAEQVINPLIASGNNLILDCTNLDYMNTIGLVLLMKCHIKLKRRNGSLKIVNPNKQIYEIMNVSGALKLLKVYSTQEEAIISIEEKSAP